MESKEREAALIAWTWAGMPVKIGVNKKLIFNSQNTYNINIFVQLCRKKPVPSHNNVAQKKTEKYR